MNLRAALPFFLLSAAVPTARAQFCSSDLVTNGSFESGPGVSAFVQVNPGSTSVPGWSVLSGSVDYIGSYWGASAGSRSFDMNGATAGTISTDVPTEVSKAVVVE